MNANQADLGTIKMFAGAKEPEGWRFCRGQLLSTQQFPELFSLIGTTYGGDGQINFALPDFRGRVPVHQGQGPNLSDRPLGERGGSPTVTLSRDNLPPHSHRLQGTSAAANTRRTEVPAQSKTPVYAPNPPTANMSTDAVGKTGNGKPLDNMAPYLTTNFIICVSTMPLERAEEL